MQAYGEYMVLLANARVDELRREAANARLADAVERRAKVSGVRARKAGRWSLRKRRSAPEPVIPLPVAVEEVQPVALRRSA